MRSKPPPRPHFSLFKKTHICPLQNGNARFLTAGPGSLYNGTKNNGGFAL
nr:MAG TPA: hypothetical protein [Caudoviricetes sp.]